MKKSTVLFIVLTAVFVAIGWIISYPYRIIFLTIAIATALLALLSALKGGETNGKEKNGETDRKSENTKNRF